MSRVVAHVRRSHQTTLWHCHFHNSLALFASFFRSFSAFPGPSQVDLDCFYVAVERGLDPSLRGVPCAVVQYNPFGDLSSRPFSDDRRLNASNGSIIALSYEAKAQGVKRTMRGDDARKICPEIQLVQVVHVTFCRMAAAAQAHASFGLTELLAIA